MEQLIDDKIQDVKKKIRNKKKIYENERKKVLENITNIMGKVFSTQTFEDAEKRKQFVEIEEDIKKYFCVSNWSGYKTGYAVGYGKREVSIIKALLKDMNIKYTSNSYISKENQSCITEYTIEI